MSSEPRVVLVTGGAVRVGRAIVTEMAGAGWSVAFTYRA
jgi:NAD(P)-dependent dehydrogenase (short-subunit alcohol dehydrogenase family)